MFMLKSTHQFYADWQLSKFKELERQLADLKYENEELKKEISKNTKVNTDQLNSFIAEADTAMAVIDWEKLNVVSVERAVTENYCVETIIGYLPEGCVTIQEWFIQCDIDGHDQLCADFQNYLAYRK